ncbi:hypothetical protein JGI7_00824 [Candidatus Kryptonium thompsonii]|jgi:hypothetical protein|uniref:Uncharacterized protein n=3 Tax=Candidatus Kryptonium thompsonii TaxID=1633631 RepID=A0A0P1P3V1_9BACT|nr:hypothetical protein [Candidatus Kryptonium thompsoni]CUS77517.1 hypothetical protein JGI14_100244 [Candidatus Kryptonium thompsoni]CUS79728.1 hypothetical protein JGI13_00459 [Candidatus Kryptonium thompsoni]CUS80987.1 hypothetical protein JGI10_00585 [Candidatus Kryptonium thompsoni]CUS82946.1 hypothetical protein JGI15_101528 [Candidatus Kryptonium thompsoni]CUS84582.1 hypothetical protein JGI7_00824 [Candidatus Kryptonium thompsoni]
MLKSKFSFLALILLGIVLIAGCTKESEITSPLSNSDKEIIKQIIENDDLIATSDVSLNDGTYLPPDFDFGSLSKEIYPLRWGRVVKKVTREYEYEQVNDTLVVVTVIRTVESDLKIAGTYTQGQTTPDTVVTKPLKEVFKRKVQVVKRESADGAKRWRIWAVSLVQGGTENSNIVIKKIALTLPNGNVVEVTDPLNQFYRPGFLGHREGVPAFNPSQPVKVSVTVQSATPDTDIVSMTFGVDRFGFHRARKLFRLVSQDGTEEVYEANIKVHLHRGSFNAMIHAISRESLFDDSAPVSVSVWGVPYVVF